MKRPVVQRKRRRRDAKGASGPQGVPPLAADRHAWFLDIDGTLLELAEAPDRVHVAPSLVSMLGRLARISGGALALVSGRRIADIDRLFAPLHLPAAGQHGLERRGASGNVHWHAPHGSEIPRMLALARAWTAERPGLRFEDKTGTFAVHFRQAPHLAAEVQAFLQGLMERGVGNYCLQPGKMVLEIRPESRDKGEAVREFMGEQPFAGRTPVFIGDDASDEQAFSVVEGLGGVAIKVGAGQSVARWRLNDVREVRSWMGRSIRVATGK